MRKLLYSFIYKCILGWKYVVSVPFFDKCVICAAPHTTNYDLFVGKLFYGVIGKRASFLIKKEWFFFPFDVVMKLIGGIPVDRRHKTSLTQQMVEVFNKRRHFNLAITPEGTRQANADWKKGFYYIALEAKVPIVLIGIDYPSKTINATKYLMPNGDVDTQMNEIKHYFLQFKGRHPENFAI
jgi:1-acyl-sn-glycerol-3-phosphate acyltransferase